MLDDVGDLVEVHLTSFRDPGEQGQLVGEGSRRGEQGRFLAGELGGFFFQGEEGGILPQDIVAHFGVGHGPSHGGGRTCDSIGTQIDHIRNDDD